MSLRSALRRSALVVPPVRRLFDFAMAESARANAEAARVRDLMAQAEAQAEHANLEAARVGAERQRVETLLAELAALNDERNALELQLYVLRSDHQRAAEQVDRLRGEKRHASKTIVELRTQLEAAQSSNYKSDILLQRLDDDRAQTDFRHAQIAGRLSEGLAILETHLRATRGGSIHPESAAGLYLDLLQSALTGALYRDKSVAPWQTGYDPAVRAVGRDWPAAAASMIGTARMRNIRTLVERILEAEVPGDLIEAGVWRGGACIFMRGILAVYGDTARSVWVADSFQGLPPPDPDVYPADAGDRHFMEPVLAVSLEQVRENFAAFHLLDDRVRFLPGWFADTLPSAPIEQLALLRLDGDMYGSTIQILNALYDKVSAGGYIIVDDFNLKGCHQAVIDFRARRSIDDAIEDIDGAGAFWRKNSTGR